MIKVHFMNEIQKLCKMLTFAWLSDKYTFFKLRLGKSFHQLKLDKDKYTENSSTLKIHPYDI